MTVHLGFIGFGQMAQAMAKGFQKHSLARLDLYASARDFHKLEQAAHPLDVTPLGSNEALVKTSDWIVLATKPDQIEPMIRQIEPSLFEKKCIINIASGVTTKELQALFPSSTHILSMIPNTPVSVGEGVLMCQKDDTLTDEQRIKFQQIFCRLGVIHFVDSDAFKSLATLSGCGPAFVALIIEAMADAMVKYGAPRQLAYQIASQTLKGTAQMQLDTQLHPGILKDQVTSPGGTTIKGIAALEEHGIRHAFMSAMASILE